jgi:hypothetical protein
MSRTLIEAVSHKAPLPTALWPSVRALTLAGATISAMASAIINFRIFVYFFGAFAPFATLRLQQP